MSKPDWVAEARRLAVVFGERAAGHDRAASFPFENFDDLAATGFMKLTVPKRWGGFEAPLRTYLEVLETLAAGDGSTAAAFMMHAKIFGQQRDGATWPEAWVEEMARGAVAHGWTVNTIATEEGLGSPAGGGLPETVAVADGDGWRLTGRKTFSTLSPILKYFVVLARIDAPSGPDLANFVVYREDLGFAIDETWDTLGMRATGSHDVVLRDCLLPAARLLTRGPAGRGDPRSAAGTIWFALGVAATSLGIARSARDYAVGFAKERTPNALATIKEHPGVRTRVARMDLLLQRSRAFLHAAAAAWEARGDDPRAAGAAAMQAMLAKVDTLNSAIEIVDLAMRVVGGVSLQRSRPLERYYRDVRAGLHNPPLEDRALEAAARAALDGP